MLTHSQEFLWKSPVTYRESHWHSGSHIGGDKGQWGPSFWWPWTIAFAPRYLSSVFGRSDWHQSQVKHKCLLLCWIFLPISLKRKNINHQFIWFTWVTLNYKLGWLWWSEWAPQECFPWLLQGLERVHSRPRERSLDLNICEQAFNLGWERNLLTSECLLFVGWSNLKNNKISSYWWIQSRLF